MGYKHLSIAEREVIIKMQAQEASMTEIGEYLGRSVGTISRELRRNISSTGEYKAYLAQRYYGKRRAASKQPYRLEDDAQLRAYVRTRLKKYWSPQQISSRLGREKWINISAVTIYSWIRRDRSGGGELYKFLRQSHRRRRKRHGSSDNRGVIQDRRMIDERPQIANQRRRIGDWESDTVEGCKNSGLLATHVDRKSRYLIAIKLENKSADMVINKTLKKMKKLPSQKLKTMTFDNGKEFAGFKQMEAGLGLRSFFAYPYHSWERGTNENTNGLLRQFFPKGIDFSKVSQRDVDRAAKLLNNRPRKCLKYRTPTEVFNSQPKRCASD